MSTQEIQAALVRDGIRIEEEMAAYISRQLASRQKGTIPILGGNAMTGVPMRILFPLEKLATQLAAASQRSAR